MLIQEGTKDGEKRSLLRELNRTKEEVALQTWIDDEGTSSGIHRCDVHSALDLLNCELCTIVPMLVVFVLANEGDSTLGVIRIKSGHVKIINEVNELILANRPIDLSSSTLELLLQDVLK